MTHQKHLKHSKYRPDIDGLRSVAVVSVVGFHAFPNWINGGFIGVDIFFVISGFLISSIIFSNLELNRFSLIEFYSRRIKRIYPSLLIVMFSSLLLGWYILFSQEYKQIAEHIAGGSGFVSNFILWKENGYFDNSSDKKPLLHLWSLAIEEQFYIFWPLMLSLVWKKRWSFIFITIAVAIISFIANIYATNSHPTAAFFLPVPRFWELMVGGLLAYVVLHKPNLNSKYKNTQSVTGFLLLFLGLYFLNESKAFPGWWALLPVFGTFFIISASDQACLNKMLLSNKLMVWIGLISYPLYLWHWPLLSFAKIIYVDPPLSLRIALVLFSFLLAYLSVVLIERRIRWSKSNHITIILLALSLALFCTGLFIFKKDGLQARSINKPFANDKVESFNSFRVSDNSCQEKLNYPLIKEEVCLTNSTNPEVLFIGDSHAMSLYAAILDKKITTPSVLISGHSCNLYPNIDITLSQPKGWAHNCTNIANDVLDFARNSSSVKTIIISNFYLHESYLVYHQNGIQLTEVEAFDIGHGYLVNQLLNLGKKVIFVIDVPHLKYSPEQCERKLLINGTADCTTHPDELKKNKATYINAIQKLKSDYPEIQIFDTTDIFCDSQNCSLKDDNGYFYFDNQHLNVHGSELVLKILLKSHS